MTDVSRFSDATRSRQSSENAVFPTHIDCHTSALVKENLTTRPHRETAAPFQSSTSIENAIRLFSRTDTCVHCAELRDISRDPRQSTIENWRTGRKNKYYRTIAKRKKRRESVLKKKEKKQAEKVRLNVRGVEFRCILIPKARRASRWATAHLRRAPFIHGRIKKLCMKDWAHLLFPLISTPDPIRSKRKSSR